MGLFTGCPWRAVVYIEDAPAGPRGGEAWWLTLECSHIAVRAKPSSKPDQGVGPDGAGVFSPYTVLRRARRSQAPHRVRCFACGQEAPADQLATISRARAST